MIPLKQTSFNDLGFRLVVCLVFVRNDCPLIIRLQLSSSAGVFSAAETFPLSKLSTETN